MGGTWLALVAGFGGMRDHDGRLSFAPRLPSRLDRLEFSVRWRGQRLRVVVQPTVATYTVREPESTVELWHHGEAVTVRHSRPERRPIPTPPTVSPVSQPPGREPLRRH
jgi:alpha,alpha-trehalose phosphorylase